MDGVVHRTCVVVGGATARLVTLLLRAHEQRDEQERSFEIHDGRCCQHGESALHARIGDGLFVGRGTRLESSYGRQ